MFETCVLCYICASVGCIGFWIGKFGYMGKKILYKFVDWDLVLIEHIEHDEKHDIITWIISSLFKIAWLTNKWLEIKMNKNKIIT